MIYPGPYSPDKNHPGIQSWDTGYFDLVMATGIVSIAAFLLDFIWIAYGLFLFNVVAYAILSTILVRKIIFSFDQIKEDFRHHRKGPAYFTLIASTNILASQFQLLSSQYQIAVVLWSLGLVLWLLITYSFFTTVTITSDNPGIEKGINGTWLISVVATQSIPTLGATFANEWTDSLQSILIFTLLCFFFIGCMLYIILITLILYRLIFLPLRPSELGAPYWINMGAVAITTLAGSSLVPYLNTGSFAEFMPFIKGFILFFWSVATWWIPLLLILGFWRHIQNKVPLPWTHNGYDFSYWSMVFPLGMYTVCTYEMSKALDFSFLLAIPRYFIYLAFAAWFITFMGMGDNLIRKLKPK